MSYDPLTDLKNSIDTSESAEKLRDLKQKELLIAILLEIKILNLHIKEISGLDITAADLTEAK